MKRLFREVLKSLSKNKITLICLTILIFLTSGIFTLLFDVKKSYSTTIYNYDTISKIHDLTVDLDFNPSGVVPNGGFSKIDKDNKTHVQNPIIFEADDSNVKNSYSLYVPEKDQNFIQLKNKFNNLDISDENLYIKTEDFIALYAKSRSINSDITFGINDESANESKAREFNFNVDTNLDLYVKRNGNYFKQTRQYTINQGDRFTFVNNVKLSQLGEIIQSPMGPNGETRIKEYIINPVSIFLNLETKQASISPSDYQAWKYNGSLYVLSGSAVMKLLGFSESNGKWYYGNNATNDIRLNDEHKTDADNIFGNDYLANEFTINSYLGSNVVSADVKQQITFNTNVNYELPIEWIRNKKSTTKYVWHRHVLNWNEEIIEENSNWKGSYFNFIKKLKDEDIEKYNSLKYFTYWSKINTITYKIGNKTEKTFEVSGELTKEDLDVTFKTPWDGGQFNVYNPSEFNDATNIKPHFTIRQIEFPTTNAYEEIEQEKINNLYKASILNSNIDFIRNGAHNLARNTVLEQLKSIVTEENIGLRETLTVETVDEITTSKNVFHFINVGDKDTKINGVKQNIGKLYNEQINPTIINSSITNKNTDDFILKPKEGDKTFVKIPSEYAIDLIKWIFKSYSTVPRYFKTNIIFDNYYDYYPQTQIPRLNRNQKIALLTIADNEPYSDKGPTIVGGIAYNDIGYVILVKDTIDGFSQEKVWKSVIINNKNVFSINELHQILMQQNWTLDGIIGKDGWLYIDEKYTNSMTLPIAFGTINNEYAVEIINKKTITSLIGAIKKILLKTDVNKIIKQDDLNRAFQAIQKAIEDNQLHVLLGVAKVNNEILTKTIFDAIRYMGESVDNDVHENAQYINMNGNAFIRNIIKYAIDYFKVQYVNSGQTEEERRAYLESQIQNIAPLIGIASTVLIPQLNLSMRDIFKYIKDFSQLFDVFKSLVDAIDFTKFANLINDWFSLPKHNLKPYTTSDDEYWTLSMDRIIITFFESIDEYKLKTAIKDFINLIDFNAILNPEHPDSYYAKLANYRELQNNPFTEDDKRDIKALLNKLNGYKEVEKAYTNINEGLGQFIDNISIGKFAHSLQQLVEHVRKPIFASKKLFENWNTEKLQTVDYISALISSINSDLDPNVTGKISSVQQAIIKMFNLSNKTEKILGPLNVLIPGKDEEKLSAFDLFTISKLIPNFNNNTDVKFDTTNPPVEPYDLISIDKLINKLELAKKNNVRINITKNEWDFLQNYVLITDNDFKDIDKMLEKIHSYRMLIDKLSLKNYGPLATNGNWKYDFKDFVNKEVLSYGDLAYRSALINPEDPLHRDDNEILNVLYSFLSKELVSRMLSEGQGAFIKHELNLYSLWIKIAYELYNLGEKSTKTSFDPETNKTYGETVRKRYLNLQQVSQIMKELLAIAKTDKFKELLTAYNEVKYTLPSLGILGSDDTYKPKLFKLARAHIESKEAIANLKENLNNSDEFNNLFALISNMNINEERIQEVKNIFYKHIDELTYNMGYIAASDQMPTFYVDSLSKFIENFLSEDSKINLIENEYQFDVIYNLAISYAKLSLGLSILNVPKNIFNPLLILSFPQILLFYALTNAENEGNLEYIVKKLMTNLEGVSLNDIKSSILPLFDAIENRHWIVETKDNENVNLDLSNFAYTFEKVFKTPDGKELEFFGINLYKTITKAIDNLITPLEVWNTIVFSDSGSYLAKVNYGYFNKNKKEIYDGDLTQALQNPLEMERLLQSLPDKYKIKINTMEYLIIGVDTTADYLYPVVNEENLQVDTNTQALVYVNQKGFDRMRSAYPTFALKTFVLIAAPKDSSGNFIEGKDPEKLKEQLQGIVSNVSSNNLNKVYLADELDFLNPERSIRFKTVRTIVSVIQQTSIYSVILLIVLVSFIVYFIIKRYIEARNKVIGILRAQGYTTVEIAISFCAFGWIPSAIGGLAGYLTGLFMQGKTMQIFSSYWTLENNTIPFNWISMILTTIIPIVAVSLLIYIITQFSVKRKPTELMSGLVDVNVGNIAQKTSSIFRRFGIKTKFIASMAINNFSKMLSLFLAFSTTSLISMFFLSSNNVFNRSISQTYKHRLYKFKLDLETPTTEGGPYVTYNKNNVENLLYMPNDLSGSASSNGTQLDYENPNFLRPGFSLNTDVNIRKFDPVVITKSSLDLLFDLNVELSPWDITYSNMPETQRARVIQIFERVSKEMEASQNVIYNESGYIEFAVKDMDKYLADKAAGLQEDMKNRTHYFVFAAQDSYDLDKKEDSNSKQFKFVEWDPVNETYLKPIKISTASHRQEYRDFLISAYKKIDSIDFFVGFAGIYWNENTNEKYSYAKTKIHDKDQRIYGYKANSQYIKLLDDYGHNLMDTIEAYNWDVNKAIPVVVNKVTANNLGLKVDSVFNGKILNHVDRFNYRILNLEKPKDDYEFKVVGISDTYINNEIVTSKDIIDKVLGLDTLTTRLRNARSYELQNLIKFNPSKAQEYTKLFNEKYQGFNGILSNDKTPVQTIDTLTTYSASGYWGASNTFDVANSSDESVYSFFKKIFISDPDTNFISVFEHMVNAVNEEKNENYQYLDKLAEFLKLTKADLEKIRKNTGVVLTEYLKPARDALNKLYGTDTSAIYGKDIMYGASFDVNSKDIEIGFITGISNTINTILVAFIIVSFIISIVILVVITNIMIASNQRAIATFSVLGYSGVEKIFLFFFNFVPVILFACALMIPVTFAVIAIFNSFLLTTSQIFLPLTLYISTIIISTAICITVFTITSIITWNSLNKVKAIDALKGR
ncbi:Uncharacterized ABC transporter permease MG468 homolog [Metamycoplasma cloacale]|uniref:ABC transporter permease n=1 Tax=Metamycoplasma cloacale TaxID=92401 RepID=A0A2Z4LNP9_9BACT|nr:ABC transporter permease [Metamycoplasma cloacale]AWX42978.1 ABC transporter permease [Metamycoplasma cloacale]VEU79198.1 Uncharacterized ABC transporter permease MG468 homolog [Metamycoplasma cloacale]